MLLTTPIFSQLSSSNRQEIQMLTLQTHQNRDFKDLGWDARVALAVYGAFSSKEYIKAQKIR